MALNWSGEVELAFGRIRVERSPDILKIGGIELHDLQPVADIQVEGVRNQPVPRPGIGAPLAAKTRPLAGAVQVVPVGRSVRL